MSEWWNRMRKEGWPPKEYGGMIEIRLFIGLVMFIGVTAAVSIYWVLFMLMPVPKGVNQSEWIYNLARIAVLALGILTGSGAAAIAYRNQRMKERQVQMQEDGKFTERFSLAVEHLGNDNISIRVGGIYALERLARDSAIDRCHIVDVLCNHVHEQSPVLPADDPNYKEYTSTRILPGDIDAILNVLRRLMDEFSDVYVDLCRVDFSRVDFLAMSLAGFKLAESRFSFADLGRANLEGADLAFSRMDGANLAGVNMRSANLEYAEFIGATLLYAHMEEAKLREAILTRADLTAAMLQGADLSLARLVNSNLERAHLDGACLWRANLSDANLINAYLYDAVLESADIRGSNLTDANYDKNILVAEWNEKTFFSNGQRGKPDIDQEKNPEDSGTTLPL